MEPVIQKVVEANPVPSTGTEIFPPKEPVKTPGKSIIRTFILEKFIFLMRNRSGGEPIRYSERFFLDQAICFGSRRAHR